MGFEEQDLDCVMVPAGVFVLAAYHAWLLYKIIKDPCTTVIGINSINRATWVKEMMEVTPQDDTKKNGMLNSQDDCTKKGDGMKNGVLAVQTLRNNIMASTLLASTAITLSSVIGVLVSSASGSGAARGLVYGDQSRLGSSVKHFTILVCFLVAFVFNVQSIRYYNHVSFFINVRKRDGWPGHSPEYVTRALNRGSYFWSLGLRAFYFSFPLFLWTFGPIPMLVSSCILVVLLYFLDTARHFKEILHSSEKGGDTKV